MNEPSREQVKSIIERNHEVLEAIEQRKGQRYALQTEMFVACTKMQVELFGTDENTAKRFIVNLLECFDIPVEDYPEFLDNCQTVRKAQKL